MIRIESLTKKFGPRVVLNGISLDIKKAEIVFVLGRSGTGKSVLLKNIVGLMKPDAGRIWLGDQCISDLNEEQYFEVRRRCGMVFQHPALFDSMTVEENVAFGLRRHNPELHERQIRDRVKECLALVGLHDVEKRMPAQLSFGMQKRVSLARTIAIGPEVLLFDEPTTGLDPVTTTSVNRLIQDLSHTLRTTSIVVSHDMRCALDIADRIAVLDQGELLTYTTPDELKQSRIPLVQEFLEEVIHAD